MILGIEDNMSLEKCFFEKHIHKFNLNDIRSMLDFVLVYEEDQRNSLRDT